MYPVLSNPAGLLVMLIVSENNPIITTLPSPKSMNLKDLRRDWYYGILVLERNSKYYSNRLVFL